MENYWTSGTLNNFTLFESNSVVWANTGTVLIGAGAIAPLPPVKDKL